MRRWAALTTVFLLVIAAMTAATAASALARATHPKVKPGTTWTLEQASTCESETFATHHKFSAAIADGTGDRGTYKGTKKLSMTWKSGTASGAIFKGTFSSSAGDYPGTYSRGAGSVTATLLPSSVAGCASLTTAPTTPSVAFGASDTDTATVTGSGVTPTGTVTFDLCSGDTDPCSPTTPGVVPLGDTALSGSSGTATATSASYAPPATGTYCFFAAYSGDATYTPTSDSSTATECFDVGITTPEVTSRPSSASVAFGTSETDTATVTGTSGVTPTGDVTFYICPGTTPCTPDSAAGGTNLGSFAVSGSSDVATATSDSYAPPETGTYCFLAIYSGDANYASTPDSSTTAECFTTTNGSEFTVRPDPAYLDQGSSTADDATVTGTDGLPTGTVTFYVCGPFATPTGCSDANDHELGSPVTLSGSGQTATADSASYLANSLGDYCFFASYSGDATYSAATDGTTKDQCFIVGMNTSTSDLHPSHRADLAAPRW
jgi:hypothetical protein